VQAVTVAGIACAKVFFTVEFGGSVLATDSMVPVWPTWRPVPSVHRVIQQPLMEPVSTSPVALTWAVRP
jgi:hypothetical protein